MLLFGTILALSAFLYPVNCQTNNNDIEKSVSTSVAGMKELLETERQLLSSLDSYAEELEHKAALIRRATITMRTENSKSLNNAEQYLSNPLHSYALIRRMHEDWVYWELFMKDPVGEDEIEAVERLRIDLPTNIDMEEATEAMFRLQVTYDLEAQDIASGLLNGKQYNSSLSSLDCYEIGKRLLNREEDVFYAIYWLNTSLHRYVENKINDILEFDLFQIVDVYATTLLKQKMYSDALEAIGMALKESPNNAKYLYEKSHIEHEMLTKEQPPKKQPFKLDWSYYRCCRGEFDHRLSRLHCRYNSTTHPFLTLAPLKMEELYLKPYMVLYHDVLSDAEIAEIQKLSLPKLERLGGFIAERNTFEPISGRTSKGSSFYDDVNDIIKGIVQRVGDMSGFDMQCSEVMQVINYGLGGHYSPHYDFFSVSMDDDLIKVTGNRIATMMFYLSDVEQGGATVFPNIETTVYPRKGTALLWYNLDNRGDNDEGSLHAACPVIVGSKWVMTRWIREREQLFRRPCY